MTGNVPTTVQLWRKKKTFISPNLYVIKVSVVALPFWPLMPCYIFLVIFFYLGFKAGVCSRISFCKAIYTVCSLRFISSVTPANPRAWSRAPRNLCLQELQPIPGISQEQRMSLIYLGGNGGMLGVNLEICRLSEGCASRLFREEWNVFPESWQHCQIRLFPMQFAIENWQNWQRWRLVE